MSILVLGASSFYGKSFVRLLTHHDETIRELSRPQWKMGDDIPYADCVVNFASASLVAESWSNPEEWIETNVLNTTTLIRKALALGIQRFIHVSTPEVYGHTPLPVREGAPFNPSTPYAVTRAAADMMMLAYCRAQNFPVIITRTANIYGFGQPDYRFIPHAFKTLREGKKLYLDGGGDTIRGWMHVRDACEALYLLCSKGATGETYHISPQGFISVQALAQMICSRLGLDHQEWLEARPDRIGKDKNYIMDSTKLRFLGWSDRVCLNEGLNEYLGH